MTLTARWTIGSRRGNVGVQLLVRYLRADGDRTEHFVLNLAADVVPDIDYTPGKLVFELGAKGRQAVQFSAGRLVDIGLLRCYCTHRAFEATLVPEQFRVEVLFDPALWPSEGAKAELVVETTSPNEKNCRIELAVAPLVKRQ